jgi:hypothetical protein
LKLTLADDDSAKLDFANSQTKLEAMERMGR